MIIFVLLIYSDEYFNKAVSEFAYLAKKISQNYKILIVNNNSFIVDDSIILHEEVIDEIIVGDNSHYEFSGWDSAVEVIREKYKQDVKYIVFANDTFCHHRDWGLYQKTKFISGFKAFIRNKNYMGICGEKNSFGEEFFLNDTKMDGWISSYLFIMNASIVLEKDFNFSKASAYIDNYVKDISENNINFNDSFDYKLAKHLNNWLFPKKMGEGWYKADQTSPLEKLKKLESILNEKLLSQTIISKKYKIYDINIQIIFRMIKYLKAKI